MDKLTEKMRQAAMEAAQTTARLDNLRRIEIERMPHDFNQFVEDISYSKGKSEVEAMRVANGEISHPNFKPVGSYVLVMGDDDAGRMSQFIESLQKKIYNDDGTVNLPVDYLTEVTVYRIKDNGEEYLETKAPCFILENSEYSGSNEPATKRGTFNVICQKYSSIGE